MATPVPFVLAGLSCLYYSGGAASTDRRRRGRAVAGRAVRLVLAGSPRPGRVERGSRSRD